MSPRAPALFALFLALVAGATPGARGQSGADAAAIPPPGQEPFIEDIVAWINDDIITYSMIFEAEEQFRADLERRGVPVDEAARQFDAFRSGLLADMIDKQLLVQEAERLFDVDEMKTDLMRRFREQRDIASDAELERLLREYGKDPDLFAQELLFQYAPQVVVQTQIVEQLGVSEEEARAWYEAHRDELGTPTQVTFRELVLVAETPEERVRRRPEIESLADRARAGEDFVTLVREFSESPSKALDGKIGPFAIGDLAPPIADAVAALEPGTISEPVETSRGWHLIELLERQDASIGSFEELRDDVERAIQQERFEKAYREFVDALWREGQIEVRRMYLDMLPEDRRELVSVRD